MASTCLSVAKRCNGEVGPSALTRWICGALLTLSVAFLGYVFVCLLRQATTQILPNDAPLNAAVSRTLAFQGKYGIWYDGSLMVCPVMVTTGPAMLLPIAAAYSCFGNQPFVPNIVSLVLVFSTLCCAWFIVLPRPVGNSPLKICSLLISLVVLFGITGKYWDHKLFFVPLGEAWAGLLVVVAAGSLARIFRGGRPSIWASLSGFALALALNVKFITLLPALILAGFLLWSVLFRWLPRASLVYCLAAFLGTSFCFELFRLSCLGSLNAYVSNWVEFWGFFRWAGSGVQAVRPPLGQLFSMHFACYAAELGWTGLILLVPLLLGFVSLCRLFRKEASSDDWVGSLTAIQVASLLLWWFFISDLAWFRHIIPALVLLPFCCHFLLTATLASLRSQALRTILAVGWPGSIVAGCLLSPSGVWSPPRLDLEPDLRVQSLRETARYLDTLKERDPQAKFLRPDWWHHWDIQLFTHPGFTCSRFSYLTDKARSELGPHDYLINSDQVGARQFAAIEKSIGDRQQRLVYSNAYVQVYQYLPGSIAELSRASASHVNAGERLDNIAAIHEGLLPRNSSDQQIPRFTWWDHCGTREWVQYDFPKPTALQEAKVYWFDDSGVGVCRVPQSWRLLYRHGDAWKAVEGASAFGTLKDTFNPVKFNPITTTALRLEVQLQPGYSGGILKWGVR